MELKWCEERERGAVGFEELLFDACWLLIYLCFDGSLKPRQAANPIYSLFIYLPLISPFRHGQGTPSLSSLREESMQCKFK